MPWVNKARGAREQPMVCVYTCPEHGEFDAEVMRDENGDSPDAITCGAVLADGDPLQETCTRRATWTPSASVACRVRRFEVVQGKWEQPARRTYLDTRKLGEGQSMEEFRAERREIWEERRKADVMAFKRES